MADPEPQLDPRTVFAAQRTLLAWIRTGLALMGLGFVVARFGLFLRELISQRAAQQSAALPGGQTTLWLGVALVLTGVVVNILATLSHVYTLRRLRSGRPIATHTLSLERLLSILLAVLGLAMAAYLILVR